MTKFATLVVAPAILTLSGCKKSAMGIAGKWQETQPNVMGSGSTPITAEFRSDGTYSFLSNSVGMSMENLGIYTYDEAAKQLTLKLSGMKFGGKEAKISDLPTQGSAVPVEWKSDSEVLVKLPTGQLDLHRQ